MRGRCIDMSSSFVQKQISEQTSNTLHRIHRLKPFPEKLCHDSGISLGVWGQLTPKRYSTKAHFTKLSMVPFQETGVLGPQWNELLS